MTSPAPSNCSTPIYPAPKQLALAVIGAGHVGAALIEQLSRSQPASGRLEPPFRVCLIANSRKILHNPSGLDLSAWRHDLYRSATQTTNEALLRALKSLPFSDIAVVDCTASSEIASSYESFIRAGAHIVTPNKKANVLEWTRYRSLLDCFAVHRRRFLYTATVGAGLPVLSTLRDLMAGGDSMRRIEGVFSGTLSYIFNRFDGTASFSSIVREAHAQGYTEPDPRQDLSGMDVASKLLVLARQMGWSVDLDDVRVAGLLPRGEAGVFSESFWHTCDALDKAMEGRYREAAGSGSVLRFVGSISKNRVTAGLQLLPRTHVFAHTRHTDNVIAFHTERYNRTPLVIQGPGAGPDVTAGAVLADLARLVRKLD